MPITDWPRRLFGDPRDVLKILAIASKQEMPELLNDVVDAAGQFHIYGKAGIVGTDAKGAFFDGRCQ